MLCVCGNAQLKQLHWFWLFLSSQLTGADDVAVDCACGVDFSWDQEVEKAVVAWLDPPVPSVPYGPHLPRSSSDSEWCVWCVYSVVCVCGLDADQILA